MGLRTRTLMLAASTFAVLGALVGVSVAASAAAAPTDATEGGVPPYAVEYFNYPGAAKIFKEKKIKLIKGDGRILLAECGNSPQQVKIWTRDDGDFCFDAATKKGYLTMEVPKVWALETASHPISADLTSEEKKQTVNVTKTGPQDGWQSVGEGAESAQTTLVELRVTG